MKQIGILLILCLILCRCSQTSPTPGTSVSTQNTESRPISQQEQPLNTQAPTASAPVETESPSLFPLPETVTTNIKTRDARKIIARIAEIAEEYDLSISFLSGNGSRAISVNGEKDYPSASTIKAIYCQYLLQSGTDLGQTITFSSLLDRSSSSGIFTKENLGTTFTVRKLMEYTVKESDNTAYRLLFATFGYQGYNEWVESVGIPGLAFTSDYEFTQVHAEDLSLGMAEIYRFGLHDSTLIDMLKSARYKEQIAKGTNHEVASKYGYEGGTDGYHDTAIVYASAPYILTILSHIEPKTVASNQPFIEITKLTDQLNSLIDHEIRPILRSDFLADYIM